MASGAAISPFYHVLDDHFLAPEEVVALYESREPTLVFFDTLELPRYHCSYGSEEPIPKDMAYAAYGANHEVTLLEQISGTTVVLDGARCYQKWKQCVEKGDLHPVAVMHVIKETRSLNDVQFLQLATYCNIKSRDTRMRTLWEKVQVIFAFYSALMDSYGNIGDWGRFYEPGTETRCGISDIIGKALYSTSLFDDQVPPPIQARDIEYIQYLLRLTIRGSLQISIEKEVLDAVKYLSSAFPCYANKYFNHQFLHDLQEPWFTSAPLLKKILLIFLLPSFLYYSQIHRDDGDIHTVESSGIELPAHIRTRMRACLPEICDQVTCFLLHYAFQALEILQDTETGTSNSHPLEEKQKAELDLPFIHEIASEVEKAAYNAEGKLIGRHSATVDEDLEESITSAAKEAIAMYVLSVSGDKMYFLFK